MLRSGQKAQGEIGACPEVMAASEATSLELHTAHALRSEIGEATPPVPQSFLNSISGSWDWV